MNKKHAALAVAVLGFTVFATSHLSWREADSDPAGGRVLPSAAAVSPSPMPPGGPEEKAAQANIAPQPLSRPMPFLEEIPAPLHAMEFASRVSTPAYEKVRYVRIAAEEVDGKHSPFWQTKGRGRIPLLLPDGRAFTVVVDSTKSLGVSRFTSAGTIDGAAGSRALFAYNEGELSALIESSEIGSWQLRSIGGGVSQWFQTNADLIPGCGLDPKALSTAKVAALAHRAGGTNVAGAASDATTASEGTPSGAIAAAVAGKFEVRVMFAYTDAVGRTAHPNVLQAAFDLAILTVNNDFTRSQIDLAATFAGSLQVSYAEDDLTASSDKVQRDALTALSDPSDGKMDAVHAYRDHVEADLVCLVQLRSDSSSAGIGYLMDDPGQIFNATLGFSVVQYSYLNSNSVFSHELGHNLGCAHDRENAKDDSGNTTSGAYPYSFGYRFRGQDGVEYRTIMAYSPGTRLSYFSNPDVTAPTPVNRPVGVAEGQTGQADNARTIRQTAFEVASYRLSTQNPSNPGRLVNVSTRAFVGTGFQQLIAGFIVTGNEPKRLLVRGIGPTLTQFGVPGALSDPVMRIVKDGTEVARNDNWSTADTSIMSAAGAFSLPAGSRDSVAVLTLQPGAYTALIEGAGGATGIALVEGYELEANGSRFANMSTRGFADKARPMVGGFVIQPDPARPGDSKRVVIRVLGPTLETFGVADAMYDPMFVLYNSTGRKILTNDDWSSGNTGGDDFKPSVRVYAEQKISAAGLSPGNRRDSAVMVDLSPGLYTAEVTPFESLPDQPQRPGVALVEVFEVN